MKRFRVKLFFAWLFVFMILITSEGVTTLAATCTIGSTVMKPSVNDPVILDDHTHSMASKVIKQPTCTATGTRKYYCTKSGCNYSYTRSIAKTAHNYSTIVTTPPTCNSTGKTEKKCSCGATILLGTIPKTNHSYYRSTLTSASCETPGRVRVTCSKCGDYYFETIPKTGHSFSAATCTSPATCTKCGTTSGSKLGHDYAPATCTSPSKCRVCGATTGSKANHRYSTWSIDRSASCTTTGSKHRVCRDCGDVDVATIPATGHDFVSATCTSPKTCRTCRYQEGTAPGHQWGDWITDEVVSCIYDGAQHRECRICRSIETKRIISPGHDFSPATCTAPATCRRCGATTGTKAEHNWDNGTVISHISCMSDEIVRKKCTNPGCTAYRDTVTRKHTPEKHGHDYTSYHFVKTVPATCKSRGYDLYHCDACGENFEENYTDYSSHSWGDWIVDEVMTCGYDGAQHRECRVCKTTETKRIPAPGHNFMPATCTTAETCSRCGMTRGGIPGHAWNTGTVIQQISCETDEITRKTCTRPGCNVCKDIVTRKHTPERHGHDYPGYHFVKTVQASCTSRGYDLYHCDVCGKNYEENYEARLDHTPYNPYNPNDSYNYPHIYMDCGDETAKVTYTCALCEENITENLSKDEMSARGIHFEIATHYPVYDPDNPMDIEYGNLNEHYLSCSCGKYRPTESHTWVTVKESTCNEKGELKCSVCGRKKEKPKSSTHVFEIKVTPTCSKKGMKKCQICGLEETIPVDPHNCVNIKDVISFRNDYWHSIETKCEDCGRVHAFKEELPHTFSITYPEDTDASGHYVVCDECGLITFMEHEINKGSIQSLHSIWIGSEVDGHSVGTKFYRCEATCVHCNYTGVIFVEDTLTNVKTKKQVSEDIAEAIVKSAIGLIPKLNKVKAVKDIAGGLINTIGNIKTVSGIIKTAWEVSELSNQITLEELEELLDDSNVMDITGEESHSHTYNQIDGLFYKQKISFQY